MSVEQDQYRFSGYQLPKIQLDETGPAYYVVGVHPYYQNQPAYWQKPAYQNSRIIGGNIAIGSSGNIPPTVSDSTANESGLFKMLNL